MSSHIIYFKLVEFPQASMQIPIGQNRKQGIPNKTKIKPKSLKNHQAAVESKESDDI